MATAFYKTSAAPRLVRAFPRLAGASVEVWNTTCIVANFGKTKLPDEKTGCSVLINPGNPQLSGVSKFPYFPRGGPAPKEYPKKDAHHIMGYVTQWGGMEVGEGMFFSFNVIDGMVHHLGGLSLAMEIKLLPVLHGEDERCPVGRAVATSPGWRSELSKEYNAIIHTVPPFYSHFPEGNPEESLSRCYREACILAFQEAAKKAESTKGNDTLRVAVPLIGAGCRGFPCNVAVEIAAKEAVRWRNDVGSRKGQVLAFGVPDPTVAEDLVNEIERVEKSEEQRAEV